MEFDDVAIPRFKIESNFDLVEPLKAMGMKVGVGKKVRTLQLLQIVFVPPTIFKKKKKKKEELFLLQDMFYREAADNHGLVSDAVPPAERRERNPYVSEAVQTATVEVTERGAEASAATVFVVSEYQCLVTGGPPPKRFLCTRPFSFAIAAETTSEGGGRRSALPVFVGRVSDPTRPEVVKNW